MTTLEPWVRIDPKGNTGNRMIQHMLALEVQQRVPAARLVGARLPEWKLVLPAEPREDERVRRLVGHRIEFDEAVADLAAGRIDTVEFGTPSSRIEYFAHNRALFASVFAMPRRDDLDLDRHLVIHVRMQKMAKYGSVPLTGIHKDYPILPIRYYEELVETFGLPPLFVGEFGTDPISQALRQRFPDAPIIRHADAMKDWQILYSARHVAISPSTFSWLASWLSPYAETIVVPVVGLMSPQQRGDIDLLPTSDGRYVFYGFERTLWSASPEQIEQVISGPGSLGRLTTDQVARLKAAASAR